MLYIYIYIYIYRERERERVREREREMRKQSFAEDFMSVWIAFICPTFKSAFTPRLQCMLLIPVLIAFGYFFGSQGTIHGTTKLSKMHIPMSVFS